MARGVNKAIIIGNLGNDPETRHTAGGSAVTNMSVATSEAWKDKNTGDTNERTEWHRIVLFGKLAEIAGEYLKKGAKVYVEGRIQTRKWQDRDGNDRWTTEIVGNVLEMLGSPAGQGSAPANNAPQNNPPSGGADAGSQGGIEDDIPFSGEAA